MSLLWDMVYAIGGVFAVPFLLRKRWKTGKYKTGLSGRFGFGTEAAPPRDEPGRTLLLHCVSVGEVNSVGTLVKKLLAADASLRIVITTGTDTGTERAAKLYGPGAGPNAGGKQRVFPMRYPFDFSFAVERLLDRARPDAIALVELETWPNFLEIAGGGGRRIPVAIINGRISEKSFPRYRWIKPVMRAMLRHVTWIGAQTDTIAERFKQLGADRGRIEVIPTLKYDNAQVAEKVPGQEALAAAMGLTAAMRLIVGGSTGPGEEEKLLEMYAALRGKFEGLRLAIVPRHPEVVPQVVAAIERAGLKVVLRTERPDGTTAAAMTREEVFVLNTMGELKKMYALAFGVFVGRSFFKKGGGGSDMIEVAALGKPCCFGPYTSNFAEVVELLTGAGGGGVAQRGQGHVHLTKTVEKWLAVPEEAEALGRRARELIKEQQAARATDRYVEKLLEMVKR
jgi:3-deoxy-D-manno-octulosonic-acid transferase